MQLDRLQAHGGYARWYQGHSDTHHNQDTHLQCCRFAVAGGIVANIYRKDIRTTLDVDFLFFTENDVDKAANEVLSKLGLSVAMVKEMKFYVLELKWSVLCFCMVHLGVGKQR